AHCRILGRNFFRQERSRTCQSSAGLQELLDRSSESVETCLHENTSLATRISCFAASIPPIRTGIRSLLLRRRLLFRVSCGIFFLLLSRQNSSYDRRHIRWHLRCRCLRRLKDI